jgi:hypothetical protein
MSETKMKSSLDEVVGFCRILWLHQDFISLQLARLASPVLNF